jgi:CHASE3 domain sensor protein
MLVAIKFFQIYNMNQKKIELGTESEQTRDQTQDIHTTISNAHNYNMNNFD